MKTRRRFLGGMVGGILLVCVTTIGIHATTSTWTGAINGDLNNAGNWNNGVPSDIAIFSATAITTPSNSSAIGLNSLQFDASAPAYNITVANHSISGGGITNQSGQQQHFLVDGGVMSLNSNTIDAGIIISVSNNGALDFSGGTAGSATITNNTGFFNPQVAGVNFVNASAGNASIANSGQGEVTFRDSDAGNAIITNSGEGTIDFIDSSAGLAHITSTGGTTYFSGGTASSATITIAGGEINFGIDTSAGNAIIANNGPLNGASAGVFFNSNATAANAVITNNQSATAFWDSATAAGASITNNAGGETFFEINSTPDRAIITNNSGGKTSFYTSATTSHVVLMANAGGIVDFSQLSSTGISVNSIHGAGSYLLGSKGLVLGNNGDNSDVSGLISGARGSLVKVGTGTFTLSGSALYTGSTLINQGLLLAGSANAFPSSSTVTLENAADVGMQLQGFNQTIGSLAGGGSLGGSVSLGTGTLTTGANAASTLYDGVISGAGGLIKIGTGTFSLTGTNTYQGGSTIAGGTLNIQTDGNLGDSSGGLFFSNNAILQTSATIVSNRLLTLGNGGGRIDTNGFNSTFSGVIGGSGGLTKVGTGILTVSGTNTYSGSTVINGGVLRAGGPAGLPNGTAITLSNVSGALLDLHGFDASIGSLAGGGAAGGNVALGTGTVTIGTDNTSTTYAGTISGAGSLLKTGTGTLGLSGVNAFTGVTTVNAGSLALNGTLPGDAVIGPGGTLSGSGTLGNLTNLGSVTPGQNAVGTLTATRYSGAGTLNIVFNGTSHNTLAVTGNADLTGGILQIAGSGFTAGHYNVLTASSIVGSFDAFKGPSSTGFLQFSTDYLPTDVQLTISTSSFLSAAVTQNAKNVAAVLDARKDSATGNLSTTINSLLLLSNSDAQNAFAALSGDAIGSFQSIALRNAQTFSSQIMDRATAAEAVTVAQKTVPLEVAYNGDLSHSGLGLTGSQNTAPLSTVSYGLWSRAIGFFDHVDGDSSAGSPASKSTTGGFQAGYDYLVDNDILFGFSGGYSKSSLTIEDRASSGDAATLQSGVYARYNPGRWFVSGSIAYLTSSNHLTRPIQFTGVNEQATGNFTSRVYTTLAQAGYNFAPRDHFALQPFLSLRQSHLHQSAFTESGAPGLNLSVQDQTVNSLVSALGGRLAREFRAHGAYPFTVGAQAAWEHESQDLDNRITAEFEDAPGATFSVQATPRRRNAAALGLDGSVTLSKNLKGFADYKATLSSGQTDIGLFGGLRFTW